jgi:hypothetical protein
MRTDSRPATLTVVNGPLRVCVDFESAQDPIAGTLSIGDDQRSFTGWLGLISGLQRAVDDQHELPEEAADGAPQ